MRIWILVLCFVFLTGCQIAREAKIEILGAPPAEKTTENQQFVINGGPGSTEAIYHDEKGNRMTAISNVIRVPIQEKCEEEMKPVIPLPPIKEPEKEVVEPEYKPEIAVTYAANVRTFTNHIIASGSSLPDVAYYTDVFIPRKPPKIELTKSTDEERLCCDRKLTFRIKFNNVGGTEAYNIDISDVIPARVMYIEESAGSDPYFAKIQVDREDDVPKKISWQIPGPVPPEGSGTVYYTVVCPRPMPKLSCSVRFEPIFLKVGEEGKVICRVTNSGNGTAVAVSVLVVIPQGLEYKGQSIGSQENLSLGDIPPGQSAEKELIVRMRSGGRLDDITARATAENAVSCECMVPPTPTLVIQKDGPSQVTNQLPIEYTIAVKNTSTKNAVATNCILSDKLPTLTKFKSASIDGVYDEKTHTVTWKLGTLKPGDIESRSVIVIPQRDGTFVDYAEVSCDEGITVNDMARTIVRGIPALQVQKYDTEDPVEVGTTTTYVIELLNEGFKTATNLKVVNEIPESTELVDVNARDASGKAIPFKKSGNTLIFDPVPSLEAGEKLLFKITVKATAATQMLNVTRVSYDEFSKTIVVEEPTQSYQ